MSDTPLEARADDLEARLRQREALVGVIGLGYVGLPLALALVRCGYSVLGFDSDAAKVAALRRGECYIGHLDPELVAAGMRSGRLEATSDLTRLGEPDALLICVPTPLTRHREPDLSYVEATAQAIAERLRPGQLVVLESTTYPGTTEERVRPILEATGLMVGRDIFLAFSPEREDPGNPHYGTADIPKLVGGVEGRSGRLAAALYEGVVTRTVLLSSARAAEAAKLTENIFRAVNIALVNELKVVFDRLGVDIWEVLDAAETKPFGFMRFNPGPGWGGHCIPVDPFYLSWAARAHGLTARFIELAGEVNVGMPEYVMERLQKALNARQRPLKGSRVLVIGLAYKPNVSDPRESPAFEIIDRLLAWEARISYHDPHLPEAPAMRTWPELPPLCSVALTPQRVRQQDAVVIVTDHAAVDYEMLAREAALIVDTRGVYREPRDNVVKA